MDTRYRQGYARMVANPTLSERGYDETGRKLTLDELLHKLLGTLTPNYR